MKTPTNSPKGDIESNPTFLPSLKKMQAEFIANGSKDQLNNVDEFSLDGGVQLPLDQETGPRRLSFDK